MLVACNPCELDPSRTTCNVKNFSNTFSFLERTLLKFQCLTFAEIKSQLPHLLGGAIQYFMADKLLLLSGKDIFRLVTSVGQRKNFESIGEIEPQTFGFSAPMLYH